jgi:hypothetical protein
MNATANSFAHAFSTWIAGGNGLNSGKDGVMRYNSGPMRGMTRDQAQMKFQNEVWKNAAPEWKDEYAKRATTGMLAPSEQKAAASTPTVTPPMRQPAVNDGVPPMLRRPEEGGMMEQMEKESMTAASKPMDAAPMPEESTPTVSRPMMRGGRGLATSQPAFGSRKGTGASETGRVAAVRF